MSVDKIQIYCDGACSGNQYSNNTGGWGAILKYGERIKKIYGGEKNTSNQRMEITACIKALQKIKTSNIEIEIYSDSAYLVNCMNEKWYEKWESNNWRNSKKKPVENQDLWIELLKLVRRLNVSFYKVNAHTGIELNELSDELAKKGIDEMSIMGEAS